MRNRTSTLLAQAWLAPEFLQLGVEALYFSRSENTPQKNAKVLYRNTFTTQSALNSQMEKKKSTLDKDLFTTKNYKPSEKKIHHERIVSRHRNKVSSPSIIKTQPSA